MRSKKKKKRFGSHKYIRKSEHRYTFDEKKSELQFLIFSHFLTTFGKMCQISKNLANFRYFQPFLHQYSNTFFQNVQNFGSFFQLLPKMAKINKKSLVNPMIFLFLSLEISILGQKAFKNSFYKKILHLGQKRQKDDFLKKKRLLKIRARNVYNQSLQNQQVNLIARAKLGSHLRSRSVQFFNNLGIIKNKL